MLLLPGMYFRGFGKISMYFALSFRKLTMNNNQLLVEKNRTCTVYRAAQPQRSGGQQQTNTVHAVHSNAAAGVSSNAAGAQRSEKEASNAAGSHQSSNAAAVISSNAAGNQCRNEAMCIGSRAVIRGYPSIYMNQCSAANSGGVLPIPANISQGGQYQGSPSAIAGHAPALMPQMYPSLAQFWNPTSQDSPS